MSRMVSRRAQAARRVHQSAITHADAVGARLDAEYAAVGVDAPPSAEMIRSLGELIITRAQAMEAADRAHDEELADDAGPRDARDQAAEALGVTFGELRNVIAVVGDQALVKRLGLAGRTPRIPDELLQAAKMVHGRLGRIPLPQSPGLRVDGAALAADLQAKIVELGEALIAVDREAREAEATLLAKHEALAAYDQTFSGAAAALSALFVLADERDLARRVRPSHRKPGQTHAEDAADAAEEAGAAKAAGAGDGDAAPLAPSAISPGLPPLPNLNEDA